MSDDPIHDLRNSLVHAAQRRSTPWWRRRGAALGVISVLVVAAPAAGAVGGLWRPDVPQRPPAATTVATASPAPAASCDPQPFNGPKTTNANPPADVLNVLAILRRPQTTADRAGRAAARRVPVPRVAIDHVRFLGTDAAGRRHWIVPTLVAVDARAATDGCPARRATRHWNLALTSSSGGSGIIDPTTLRSRGTTSSYGDTDRESVVFGVVADGVAKVSVSYEGTAPRTWPVTDNFFTYRVALPADRAVSPTVTWKGEGGTTIKTISSP